MPMLAGWKRIIENYVVYEAPCGRRIYGLSSIYKYLRRTKSRFGVENFDFSLNMECVREMPDNQVGLVLDDISGGAEPSPISCVNIYSKTKPVDFEYVTAYIPHEGIDLIAGRDFASCCDCTDDCTDKTKCQCWQLTLAGVSIRDPLKNYQGYVYKRLLYEIPGGIYECNSRCKCKSVCLNRVVQLQPQAKLQVFKTAECGWGVRCLNDLQRGTFICCYFGELLTLKQSMKLNWPEHFSCNLSNVTEVRELKTYQNRKVRKLGEESIQSYYANDQLDYIIEPIHKGNVSRFINHSCDPNLFSQPVFVDNHDLRFPLLAFFTSKRIAAGTELTWDYNYQISDNAKNVISCLCKASNCRKRLR